MQKKNVQRGLGALLAAALLSSVGCAGAQRVVVPPACDLTQSVHLVVQASDRLNLDERGRSLPTVVRIYQLKNIARLENAEFEDVWQRAGDTLGDDLLGTTEMTVYPEQRLERSFTRNPEAAYVVGVAIVRHPAGISWRTIYELPPSPGQARCAAQQANPDAPPPRQPDPRFVFFVEDYRIEAGDDLPPEPDPGASAVASAGAPRLPQAPSMPSAPSAPSAPRAPAVSAGVGVQKPLPGAPREAR